MSELFQWFRKQTVADRLSRYRLRPDLIAAAEVMVSDRRSDQQIADLEPSLSDTETALRMMDGRHAGDRGLLMLTDQRVFFRSKSGPIAFSVPLVDVTTIEGSTRKVIGTVVITSADGSYVVDDILGTQGEMLAEQSRAVRRGELPRAPDPLAALAELRRQRQAGSITAAEFEARKAELWRDV